MVNIIKKSEHYALIKIDFGTDIMKPDQVLQCMEDVRNEAIQEGYKPLHFEPFHKAYVCEKIEEVVEEEDEAAE